MKIQHDGDGKLFYVEDKKVHWIVECDIACGDAVAMAFTNLINDITSPKAIVEIRERRFHPYGDSKKQ